MSRSPGTIADFTWSLLLAAVAIVPLHGVWLGYPFMGECLPMFIVFLYSKRNPDEKANIWGLPPGGFPMVYFPFALIGFSMIMENDPMPQLVGLFVAYVYYYIICLLPGVNAGGALAPMEPVIRVLQGARHLLATPHAWCRLFNVDPSEEDRAGRQVRLAPTGPAPFSGNGRTLASATAAAAGRPQPQPQTLLQRAYSFAFPPPAVAPGFHPLNVGGGGSGSAAAAPSPRNVAAPAAGASAAASSSGQQHAPPPSAAPASAPPAAAPPPPPSAAASGALSPEELRRRRLLARGIEP